MKRVLLIFFFIFSFDASSQRTLSRDFFMSRVRPVLSSIINDFYQMITHFPEFPKEMIPLIQEVDSLGVEKEEILLQCPRVLSEKCDSQLSSLRNKLSKIRLLSLQVMDKQRMSTSLYLNSLGGQRLLFKFDLLVEEVKASLDNTSFLAAGKISQRKESYDLIKKLDELDTFLSLSVVEFIPYSYRKDFKHFFFNFVHPVQLQISKRQNFEFFNRNLNSLNFALNLLNQNLTKRNKKTPEGMSSYLSLIHMRWNNILRNL